VMYGLLNGLGGFLDSPQDLLHQRPEGPVGKAMRVCLAVRSGLRKGIGGCLGLVGEPAIYLRLPSKPDNHQSAKISKQEY